MYFLQPFTPHVLRMLWLTNSLLEWVLWKRAEIVLNISYRNFMVVVILILWKSYETPMKNVYENYSQWMSNEKYILKFKAMKYQWKIAWKISWSAIETHVCVYIILCMYIYWTILYTCIWIRYWPGPCSEYCENALKLLKRVAIAAADQSAIFGNNTQPSMLF